MAHSATFQVRLEDDTTLIYETDHALVIGSLEPNMTIRFTDKNGIFTTYKVESAYCVVNEVVDMDNGQIVTHEFPKIIYLVSVVP